MTPLSSLPLRRPHCLPVRWSWSLLLGLAFAVAGRAQNVNLAVDATRTVRTVDERVFGVNAVLWDPQTGDATTIALCNSAGIRAIRIPGGGMSDDYHWINHTQASTSQTWPEGFNYFAPLIAGTNCQTFVTVNYGSGTPQEAAAWVAYTNASASILGSAADVNIGTDSTGFDWKTAGYWSTLRASTPLGTDDGKNFLRLGQSAPFALKYWEVGNECYGTWEYDIQTAQHDPVKYGSRFAQYFAAMKAVDPTIKIGAVAVTSTEGPSYTYPTESVMDPATNLPQTGWVPVMLSTIKGSGVMPDFLICHRYEQNAGQENDATLLQLASAPATGWLVDATLLRGSLNDYFGAAAANVELCVTENNSVHNNPGKQMNSLVNGLYLADSLGSLLRTEFNSMLWWDLRNGPATNAAGTALVGNMSSSLYGWRINGDYGILSVPSTLAGETTYYDAFPTYYVMKLLSHFARGGDTILPATSDNTLLSAFAAKRADGSLCLLVVNKSPSATLTANVSLTGFLPQPALAAYSYGIPQDTAAQTGSGSPDIATSSLSNGNSTFTASFAPYSATVLTLQPGVPSAPSISAQPVSQTVNAGQTATFSVSATGFPTPTYQWQQQVVGSSTWTNLSDTSSLNGTYDGTTTATLTVSNVGAAAAMMNGYSFRCVLTNTLGTVTTSPATLVVNTPLAVTTLAGLAGTSGSTDGSGSTARFSSPSDIALDGAGNAYVADTNNHTVRKITPAGVVTTLAGQAGVSGSGDGSGTAQFNHPAGVAVDGAGNVYVADTDNNAIRKVTATGVVTTLAGQAGAGSTDGTGTAASFNGPSGIVADATGILYVADSLNHTIRKVTPAGAVTTIAGTAGLSGAVDGAGSAARFHGPQGLVLDAAGNLFVADTNNNAIRKVVPASGAVTTVAGQTGVAGSTDGTNSQAQFHFPSGIGIDAAGNLLVADTDNHTLREIALSGAVSTLAGLAGSSGSADGTGTVARFNFPTGVAANSAGDVYLADASNHAIRLCVVPTAPAITAQPQSQTVTAGQNVTFSVTATGKPAPTYQWFFGGVMINGATSSTLALNSVQTTSAGNYTVTVTNSSGAVTSSQAALTVTPAGGGGGSSPGGGGGGGGAPSVWFYGALTLLALARRMRHRQ